MSNQYKMLQYERANGGTWTEIDDFLVYSEEEETTGFSEAQDVLTRNGFHLVHQFDLSIGLDGALWSKSPKPIWLVCFSDHSLCKDILIKGWPDLIHFSSLLGTSLSPSDD